jgi:hypothetical protein
MSRSILTPDLVSVGLLLSDGEITITLEELFTKVEAFQKENKRIFGVSDQDFRSAIFFLLLELGKAEVLNDLSGITFREIIPEMLKFNDVHFTDEGEHWIKGSDYEDLMLSGFFASDRKEYEAKMRLKEEMAAFFNKDINEILDSGQIKDFMLIHGITGQILTDCSD